MKRAIGYTCIGFVAAAWYAFGVWAVGWEFPTFFWVVLGIGGVGAYLLKGEL